MQGLAGYSGDSPPSSPHKTSESGPSRVTENIGVSVLESVVLEDSSNDRKGKMKAPATSTSEQDSGLKSGRKPERRSVKYSEFAPSESSGPSRPRSPLSRAASLDHDPFAGMTEEDILALATRPDEIEGVSDWGIPPEVNPDEAPDALKAKVEHFLRLKYERGQHINSTLLASSSFANPHIYAKLVEFVDINETATVFSSGGWLTRRNIEELIPDYGPKALSATQKAKQDAIKRTQEVGKRSNIQFAPSRRRDGDERDNGSGYNKKRSREDEYRDRDKYRPKDRKYESDRRDRERDRDIERRDRR